MSKKNKKPTISLWKELPPGSDSALVLHRAGIGAVPVEALKMDLGQARSSFGEDISELDLIRLDGSISKYNHFQRSA